MADLTTNARDIAARYAARARALDGAARKAATRIVLHVEAGAVRRTSGTGAAGEYPIPIRSRVERAPGKGAFTAVGGNLRRSIGSKVTGPTSGMVFSSARYAHAVHTSGFHAYGNKRAPFYKPRPFILDAARNVNGASIMRTELRKAMQP